MKRILYLILLLIPINVFAVTFPEVASKSVVVYDLTDKQVLYEKNKEEKRAIASLTKTITVITAIEEIEDLNEEVVVTEDILKQVDKEASTAGLKEGDVVTYKDLLYAVILPSGADAALTIALTLCDTQSEFVDKMNALAERIGMKNSQFKNVHGLDKNGHYSTAEDLKILLEYALQNKTFKEVYTTKKYVLTNGLIVNSTLLIGFTTDGNQKDISKVLGSKTGFTSTAGRCITVLFNSHGHELLIVTLGAEQNTDSTIHIQDAIKIIDFVNTNYNNQLIYKKYDSIKKIKVTDSFTKEYDIKLSKDVSLFLPNDFDKNKITINYNGVSEISPKNNIGDKLGTVTYFYDGKEIYKGNIFLDIKITRATTIILVISLFIVLTLILFIVELTIKKRRNS